MKLLIVDDETNAREIIKEFLNQLDYQDDIFEAADVESARQLLSEHSFISIFLDIEMPGEQGIKLLDKHKDNSHVIFTTAYSDFAIEAFELHACDYLLKPYSFERFKEAFNRALSQPTHMLSDVYEQLNQLMKQSQHISRISIKENGRLAVLNVIEIVAIEALADYTKIIKEDRSYFIDNRKMHYFESVLDDKQFIRIHRSTIVNLDQVKDIQIDSDYTMRVLLKNGLTYNASKSGQKKLKELGNIT